ncbi:MAG: 2-dehydropantoate 2-reductase [Geminicoccaceae bacterium]|nr:2-dehydropantoate 2-reductase [Geminicoccaceae bacterium]MCS7268347.1 2-dehydropantoate 2-reductase [Geminicoccaceae bacterium]MCX7629233.1 2-dehydropantoate 2-reductase [Geminicoccaceae bacterium]MDW8124602.1 2-dehydropantoate 2-reductase [Geminicoccaceae bacterium]MDW8341470.1 2-dehydropantoate 2-reductase [Geminicoccaceae bacterium]
MRICVFGAGAIGGYLAAKLASREENEVGIVARGAHLAAIRERGLVLVEGDRRTVTHPRASANAAELGVQDYVIVTLKAHQIPAAVPAIETLLGPETAIVWAVNGVPWWYFYGLEGPWRDRRLESVDPGGVIWDRLRPERAIGCVVYPAAEVHEPGVVTLVEGDRFSLGEPDGSRSARVERLAKALVAAGLKAPVRPKIRDEIWVKLWGNLAFNPISALTRATLDVICADQAVRAVARAMMREAQEVAEKLGVRFAIDVDKRIEGAAAVGAHKTSMLQDLERGRPMEIDALVTAVLELARLVEVPTPTIATVHALVTLEARVAGCYPTS